LLRFIIHAKPTSFAIASIHPQVISTLSESRIPAILATTLESLLSRTQEIVHFYL
jgi:hypothetical protein